MKIAFDSQIFTYQSYGGVSRYFTRLAAELMKLNQDIKVFAGLHRNNYLPDLPFENVSGFKVSNYPPKAGRFFRLLNHVYSDLGMSAWKPSIVHETYYSSRFVMNSSVRIATVYDMIHELFPDQFSPKDQTTVWKKATFSRVDHIVSISESTKRDLIEIFGVDENKISVVHLGVDLKTFQGDFLLDSDVKFSKPYVLYVGNRKGYKNFNGFIQSYSLSKNLMNDFNVVCFGGGAFSTDEQLYMNRLGIKLGQVVQIGGDDKVLVGLYRGASAFVFPSLYEGFGLPPLEAMAAGCPVISSNSSSMPEVVRNAGVYFEPNSIDDMKEVMEKTIYSESTCKDLVKLGHENVKCFSWQTCAKETLSIYKALEGMK